MPTTPPQPHESDSVRPPFRTVAVTGVPSANSGHCSAIPDAVATLWEPATQCKTCSALLQPLCSQLPILPSGFSLRRNPRTAWARPSEAAPALTRTRPCPAGPSERRHATHGGRYPLQQRPRRPLELQGRWRNIRKAKDDTQDDCHARRHTPQCTFYSARPLHPRDSGRRRRISRSPVYVHRPSLCL